MALRVASIATQATSLLAKVELTDASGLLHVTLLEKSSPVRSVEGLSVLHSCLSLCVHSVRPCLLRVFRPTVRVHLLPALPRPVSFPLCPAPCFCERSINKQLVRDGWLRVLQRPEWKLRAYVSPVSFPRFPLDCLPA